MWGYLLIAFLHSTTLGGSVELTLYPSVPLAPSPVHTDDVSHWGHLFPKALLYHLCFQEYPWMSCTEF